MLWCLCGEKSKLTVDSCGIAFGDDFDFSEIKNLTYRSGCGVSCFRYSREFCGYTPIWKLVRKSPLTRFSDFSNRTFPYKSLIILFPRSLFNNSPYFLHTFSRFGRKRDNGYLVGAGQLVLQCGKALIPLSFLQLIRFS